MSTDEEFAGLVRERTPALLRYAHLLTGNRARAEDLVQSAFAAAYRHRRRIDPAGAEAYVRRAVLNSYLSWWQRGRLREQVTDRPPDRSVADGTAAVDERDAMWAALATLPPRQRAVLLARRIGGGPVEVSVLTDPFVLTDEVGSFTVPQFVELRQGGRRWFGSLLRQGDGASCLQLSSGPAPDVLVARCRPPDVPVGGVSVLAREGIRITEIRIEAAGPAEQPLRVTDVGDAFTTTAGAGFPTGPGEVRLEDVGGLPRPPVAVPAYS